MKLRRRLGPFIGENFIQERFWPKISKSVLGPIFHYVGIFPGLNINLEFSFSKSLTLAWSRVVQAIARENLPGDLTCRSVNKKGIYNTKNFRYIYPFAEKPPMNGLTRNFPQGVVSRTQSPVLNFVSIGSMVSELRGIEFCHSLPVAAQVCATARLWCTKQRVMHLLTVTLMGCL